MKRKFKRDSLFKRLRNHIEESAGMFGFILGVIVATAIFFVVYYSDIKSDKVDKVIIECKGGKCTYKIED